jgi:hypothetical protein
MTYPEININGTDADDLITAYSTAHLALGAAHIAMSAATPHGRDYQTHQYPQAAYSNARNDHVEMMMQVAAARDAMFNIMMNLMDQRDERNERRQRSHSL